jgi:nucleotide-binding universal stress UspA family protein
MKPLHRVAVGTDFTPEAVRAARRALRLPLAPAVRLELIHAVPRIAPRALETGVKEAALAALERQATGLLRRDVPSPVRIRRTLANGPPAEALAREARARRCELLVIGPLGGQELPDLDLGSTAERLLAESVVPVLIARRPPRGPYRHLLVAVDLDGWSGAALDLAMRLMPDGAGRITLLHAIDLPAESALRLARALPMEFARIREESRNDAGRLLAAEARRVKRKGFVAGWSVSDGDPRSVILDTAHRLRADLVALGTREAGDRTGSLLGSVARWVARRASCDVLVARMRAR